MGKNDISTRAEGDFYVTRQNGKIIAQEPIPVTKDQGFDHRERRNAGTGRQLQIRDTGEWVPTTR